MKTVLLFGTFDFLHVGHLHLLREAKKLGDRLVVCVARDASIQTLKGTLPMHTEQERKELVSHIDLVDTTILGDTELGVYSFFDWLVPDVIAIGYDQDALAKDIARAITERKLPVDIQTLSAYKEGSTSTSKIKQLLGI